MDTPPPDVIVPPIAEPEPQTGVVPMPDPAPDAFPPCPVCGNAQLDNACAVCGHQWKDS
jgi:hypothetical protein